MESALEDADTVRTCDPPPPRKGDVPRSRTASTLAVAITVTAAHHSFVCKAPGDAIDAYSAGGA